MDRKSELVPIGKSAQSSHPRTSALTRRPSDAISRLRQSCTCILTGCRASPAPDAKYTGKVLLTQYTFTANATV